MFRQELRGQRCLFLLVAVFLPCQALTLSGVESQGGGTKSFRLHRITPSTRLNDWNECCLRPRLSGRAAGTLKQPLRIRGGGYTPPFPRGSPPDFGFGSMQFPQLGSGFSLYAPIAALVALVAYGQVMANVRKGIRGWTPTTRQRVRATYSYFGGSVLVWALSAFLAWKTGLVPSHPLHVLGIVLATFYALYKVMVLNYERERYAKAAYFLLLAGLNGVNLSAAVRHYASANMLHIIVQAAAITAADVAAVTAVVASSPSTRFLWLAGPLAGGLGLLIGANLVNMLMGSRTLHLGLAYAGAALFTGHLLLDTSKVIVAAKAPPTQVVLENGDVVSEGGFDPVRHAVELYLDTVNLFHQMLAILTDGEVRRRGAGDGEEAPRRPPPSMRLRPPPRNW